MIQDTDALFALVNQLTSDVLCYGKSVLSLVLVGTAVWARLVGAVHVSGLRGRSAVLGRVMSCSLQLAAAKMPKYDYFLLHYVRVVQ